MKLKLAAMALLAASAVLFPVPSSPALAACGPLSAPVPVSHRGGTEFYVENTRNSFRSSSQIGANFWETDVRFTSDNVPMILHDDTVDRTTDGTGKLSGMTYAEVAKLRTADGQAIPTLVQLMADQSLYGARIFVELKDNPTSVQWANFGAALARSTGPVPIITSFNASVLDQAASRFPRYQRGLIQGLGDADPATITPHASMLLKQHDAITSARALKWTRAGLKVYAWSASATDPTTEWARIAGYFPRVVGYITNTPQAYLKWSRSRVVPGCVKV